LFGLYLHIPFCSAICNYCNFNRGLMDATLKVRYVDALRREIQQTVSRRDMSRDREASWAADTIYFGGGTPSLLSPADVAALIDTCRTSFDLASDAEVTLEANPETVSLELLAGFRAAGVNRLSFGVQSFRDDELQRLSRLHGAQRARTAYAEARTAGFNNVSLDLMMWLPGQRPSEWLESVDAAIELSPDHLSLYMLEVYPNAPLRDLMARSAWSQAPDDDVAEMYEGAMERLTAAGYHQYEISNVAKDRHESRHNLKYWTDGEWWGFGCGAHSTIGAVRWKNVSDTGDYIDRVAAGRALRVDERRMLPEARLGDAIFTGLRLTAGLDVAGANRRYATDIWGRYGAELERFVEAGLLTVTPDRWTLTRRGMLLAHEVMAVFV
jgi:oxygen-independent coproporphyrinogen-3 oxidase